MMEGSKGHLTRAEDQTKIERGTAATNYLYPTFYEPSWRAPDLLADIGLKRSHLEILDLPAAEFVCMHAFQSVPYLSIERAGESGNSFSPLLARHGIELVSPKDCSQFSSFHPFMRPSDLTKARLPLSA